MALILQRKAQRSKLNRGNHLIYALMLQVLVLAMNVNALIGVFSKKINVGMLLLCEIIGVVVIVRQGKKGSCARRERTVRIFGKGLQV